MKANKLFFDSKKMEEQYQKIANSINNMIRERWYKVLFYAEVDEERAEFFFFYFPTANSEPIYCWNSSNIINTDYEENNLFSYIRILWEEFIKQKQEPWTSMTMTLIEKDNNSLDFKIKYDYTKFDEEKADAVKRQIVWEYKNLGIKPTHPSDIQFLEKYLKDEESTEKN